MFGPVEKLMVAVFEARFQDELSKTNESRTSWAWMKNQLRNVIDVDEVYKEYKEGRLKELMG